MRELHRDFGYMAVGITLIYAISGIILNHKGVKEDPAYKTVTVTHNIAKHLDVDAFKTAWNDLATGMEMAKVFDNDTKYLFYLKGGIGDYYPETGEVSYEYYKKKPLVYFMNKLHYNQPKGWVTISDIYAGALIFLALSGLFMVRGKKGITGPRFWFFIGGIVLVVVFIWV